MQEGGIFYPAFLAFRKLHSFLIILKLSLLLLDSQATILSNEILACTKRNMHFVFLIILPGTYMMIHSEKLQIREIEYNSPEYKKELELRDKVLRKPLGMSLFVENLDADKSDVHIGAFIHNKLVGVLILTRLHEDQVKMRQVAVDEEMRFSRIGTQMVQFAEMISKNRHYKTMVLNARKTAVAFYETLGYETVSDEFLEINIPHFKMRKDLLK